MTEPELSEWAKTRIERLKAALTSFKIGNPCPNCEEVLYYCRAGREHSNCIKCHDERSTTNTILTPIEGGVVDGNGVKLRPRERPKDGCKVCGCMWILDQNAYGQRAGYCHQCTLDAIPEREKSKAIHKLSVEVNKVFWGAMHSSVMRSGTEQVLPRDLTEWYALKALIERLTLMNKQERELQSGVRWELGHIYPAAGADPDDIRRGVCRVENLHIIESRRNRAEGNKAPDEWLPVMVIEYARFDKILKSHQASAALKARKAEILGEMTPQQKESFDKKIKEQDEQHDKLTADILKGEAHKFEALLNTILIPTFRDKLDELTERLERSEYKTSKLIDALLQSGQREDSFTEYNGKRLIASSFMNANARLRAATQTLQRIDDAHDEASTREDYDPETWENLMSAAVLWARDALSHTRVNLVGFTHPLLKQVRGEAWGVSVASNGDAYLCVWEDEPDETDDSLPFDAREWEGFKQRKKLVAIEAEGWTSCMDVFTYEREAERKARAAARAKAEAAAARADAERREQIKKLVEDVRAYMGDLFRLPELRAEQWRAALSEALAYYASEISEHMTEQHFTDELTAAHEHLFTVDNAAIDANISECVEFLEWSHVDVSKTKQAVQELYKFSTSKPHIEPLRISQPFDDAIWLNAADREIKQRREAEYHRADIESQQRAAAEAQAKAERQRKAEWMKSPEGQAWLARKKATPF